MLDLDLPRLSCGDNPIAFDVYDVYENPKVGVSSRVAAVMATLPEERRVLFLVFKGTSLVTDLIVDACIMPNFAPFMRVFGDSRNFVHHGAYHAIEQLGIHYSTSLLDLLEDAAKKGATEFIVTGHSLGGMYAKAFMLELYFQTLGGATGLGVDVRRNLRKVQRALTRRLMRRKPKARAISELRLVREARCVTFGAPAIFGANPSNGSTIREDLKLFMRASSINYVHENDPCPRAWAHLDIRKLATSVAREQVDRLPLPAVVRGQVGGFVMRKLASVLKRRDFREHLLETARLYQELSAVRFLTREPYRNWTVLESFDVEHHLMPSYIACLRDATYDGSGAYLYDDNGVPIDLR